MDKDDEAKASEQDVAERLNEEPNVVPNDDRAKEDENVGAQGSDLKEKPNDDASHGKDKKDRKRKKDKHEDRSRSESRERRKESRKKEKGSPSRSRSRDRRRSRYSSRSRSPPRPKGRFRSPSREGGREVDRRRRSRSRSLSREPAYRRRRSLSRDRSRDRGGYRPRGRYTDYSRSRSPSRNIRHRSRSPGYGYVPRAPHRPAGPQANAKPLFNEFGVIGVSNQAASAPRVTSDPRVAAALVAAAAAPPSSLIPSPLLNPTSIPTASAAAYPLDTEAMRKLIAEQQLRSQQIALQQQLAAVTAANNAKILKEQRAARRIYVGNLVPGLVRWILLLRSLLVVNDFWLD